MFYGLAFSALILVAHLSVPLFSESASRPAGCKYYHTWLLFNLLSALAVASAQRREPRHSRYAYRIQGHVWWCAVLVVVLGFLSGTVVRFLIDYVIFFFFVVIVLAFAALAFQPPPQVGPIGAPVGADAHPGSGTKTWPPNKK